MVYRRSISLYSVFGAEVHIEHFGSTSVPKLVAKPIVDNLIGVNDFPNFSTLQLNDLELMGYECLGTVSLLTF